jgi:hypothetical protein
VENQDDAQELIRDLAARLAKLEDKERIREVLYSNSRGMDRADVELLKSTYHSDSYEVHWETFTGNGHEFSEFITSEIRSARSVSHVVTNPLIEVEGDRAFCESTYTARTIVDRTPDLGGWVEVVVWGRYLDVLERRDGQWRISYRQLARDGARRHIVPNPLAPAPETASRTGRDDPSYLTLSLPEHRPPQHAGSIGMFTHQRKQAPASHN